MRSPSTGPGLSPALIVGLTPRRAPQGLDVPLIGINDIEAHLISVLFDPAESKRISDFRFQISDRDGELSDWDGDFRIEDCTPALGLAISGQHDVGRHAGVRQYGSSARRWMTGGQAFTRPEAVDLAIGGSRWTDRFRLDGEARSRSEVRGRCLYPSQGTARDA